MGIARKTGYFSLIAALIIAASCSVQEHHRTLSFFFDGVPLPQETSTLNNDSLGVQNDSASITGQTYGSGINLHQPYLQKACNKCHNQGRMGSLTEVEPGLCYQCHLDFSSKYTMSHGPVAGGYCTICHDPHKSKEENLLNQKEDQLCLHCHDPDPLFAGPFHEEFIERECVSCHSPHGSDNFSLLRKGACYQCHNDPAEQYSMVHGPVAAGQCTVCHSPHYENSEKLLIRTGREQCFYCHDSSRINEGESHSGLEDLLCTECHNPHGGSDRYLFNE